VATRVQRTPEHWAEDLQLDGADGRDPLTETRAALAGILNAAYAPEAALAKLKEQVER